MYECMYVYVCTCVRGYVYLTPKYLVYIYV